MSSKLDFGFKRDSDIDLDEWTIENAYWIAYDCTFEECVKKLKSIKDICYIS